MTEDKTKDAGKEVAKTPFADEIVAALAKLDHAKDADWTEDGQPSLKRIIQLTKNNKIVRADVNAAAPEARREAKPLVAAGSRKPVEASKDAGKEVDGVRVRAIRKGQYAGAIREVGEEFTYSGALKSWMEIAPKAKDEKPAKADKE